CYVPCTGATVEYRITSVGDAENASVRALFFEGVKEAPLVNQPADPDASGDSGGGTHPGVGQIYYIRPELELSGGRSWTWWVMIPEYPDGVYEILSFGVHFSY